MKTVCAECVGIFDEEDLRVVITGYDEPYDEEKEKYTLMFCSDECFESWMALCLMRRVRDERESRKRANRKRALEDIDESEG